MDYCECDICHTKYKYPDDEIEIDEFACFDLPVPVSPTIPINSELIILLIYKYSFLNSFNVVVFISCPSFNASQASNDIVKCAT